MPLAVTLLGSATFNTNSGTKTVTATPAVGDLIAIVTGHTGNTSTTAPTDNNSSGTYTLITSAVKAPSADTLAVYVRTALVGAASSTVFSHAPGTSTGGGLAVFKVTGASAAGLAAIVQSAVVQNQGNSTPSVAMGAAITTTNAVIGAVLRSGNPANMTPPASWTERLDTGYSSPPAGIEIATRDSGETGSTITWGDSSAGDYCALVVELKGSQIFNETLSEGVTASDAASVTATFAPAITEAVTAGSNTAAANTASFSLSEGVTLSAAQTGGLFYSFTINEGIASGDALTVTAIFRPALSESVATGANQAAAASFVAVLSEGVGAGDALAVNVTFNAAFNEGVTVFDILRMTDGNGWSFTPEGGGPWTIAPTAAPSWTIVSVPVPGWTNP